VVPCFRFPAAPSVSDRSVRAAVLLGFNRCGSVTGEAGTQRPPPWQAALGAIRRRRRGNRCSRPVPLLEQRAGPL